MMGGLQSVLNFLILVKQWTFDSAFFHQRTDKPVRRKSALEGLYTSEVAHQVGAYPGFSSMKRLGVLFLSLGWDASPSQSNPQH